MNKHKIFLVLIFVFYFIFTSYQLDLRVVTDEAWLSAPAYTLLTNGKMFIPAFKGDPRNLSLHLPLHTSPMGEKLGYQQGELPVTEDIAGRILRLPFYNSLTENEQEYVVGNLMKLLLR